MPVDIYSNLSGDGFESEELKLFNLVNEYRAQNGLDSIPASKALSTVANRHVQDLAENVGQLTHGWSDQPYNASDSSTYDSMWSAPQRFNTGYRGNGYENAFYTSGQATAESALDAWKTSGGHNDVILNQGIWSRDWNALGVGIYENYAVLWFGHESDPTGTPTGLTLPITGAPTTPKPTTPAPVEPTPVEPTPINPRPAANVEPSQYVASHPDLIRAIGYNMAVASQHYNNYGSREGRATDTFDEYGYLASHRDLLGAFGSNTAAATQHYIQYGYGEGRRTDLFDGARYLASNADLIRAFGYNPAAATQHYVTHGVSEQRSTQGFDAAGYLNRYSDLRGAFGSNVAAATQHFINHGYGEGRSA